MAGISLYPPIFSKAYMPAFDTTAPENATTDPDENGGCRVYFSLSAYNNLSQLARKDPNNYGDFVQVSVQGQSTNYTALNIQKYPTGIKLTSLRYDKDRKGEDKYFIVISPNDLQPYGTGEDAKAAFRPGQFYKVQIRFTAASATFPKNDVATEEWLRTNIGSFSQWSQVVLIKGIQKPTLVLRDFSENADQTSFTLKDIIVAGKLNFRQEDNEFLKQYRIYIYDQNNKLVDDSGYIYSNQYSNTNEINYKIRYDMGNGQYYTLKIYYMSSNLYENIEEYSIYMDLVQYTTLDPNNVSITAAANDSSGSIDVTIKSKQRVSQLGTNLIIRRTSNQTNFKLWDDVYTFLAPAGKTIDITWSDRIVENGVWYKYSVQQRNQNGFRSNFLEINSPVMVIAEDIFLLNSKYQLKIKFDPQINSYSHVVSESSTQTIGSKYPFIRRNGNVDYRTFSLSGTISHFMDTKENGMKASPANLYGDALSNYQKYNSNHNITPFNDYVYERDFREKVISFLYDNNVKLYKSTTEGNMLVKLMNITFTPNNTLGRQIYSFSCNVYEVDQFNFQNCDKYNIQSKGGYTYETQITFTAQGEVYSPNYDRFYATGTVVSDEDLTPYIPKTSIIDNYGNEIEFSDEELYENRSCVSGINSKLYFTKGEDIIKSRILPKYKHLENDYIDISIDHVSYLKIELTSPPYLIANIKDVGYRKLQPEQISGGEEPQNDNQISYNTAYKPQIFLGHLIKLNSPENVIMIGEDGIYQISGDDVEITSLSFVEDGEQGFISYQATIKESEKTQNIPKSYQNFRRVGQVYGAFLPSESIYKKIFLRYYQKIMSKLLGEETKEGEVKLSETLSLQRISGMRITANQNLVVAVREGQDNNGFDYFEIGQTGVLEFYDDNTDIRGLYIMGPKLVEVEYDPTRELRQGQYMVHPGTGFSSFEDIPNPKDKCVYHFTNKQALSVPLSRLSIAEATTIYRITANENSEITQVQLDTANILSTAVSNSLSGIYYHGGWYVFSDQDEVVLGYPSEIIIDYYCQILRERYLV